MSQAIFNIVSIIGALALFIYGMKVMSEAIQKVAGTRLRKALNAMTARQSYGVLTGFALTALLQSSSATTVMVVSFVNAGLLNLVQSIGVIMGANLGTTVTAWLVALANSEKFSLSLLILPLLAVALPLIFVAKERTKQWGEVLIGFALLLLGLSLVHEALPKLEAYRDWLDFIKDFNYQGQGFFKQLAVALLFVLVGAILTIAVQSSSAAIAFTIIITSDGWISFPLAAAIILGENIGTTITANLAATVGNVHAKRSARAHFLYNALGVVWAVLLLSPFLSFIAWCASQWFGTSPISNAASIPLSLALFHTLFNLFNLILLFAFIPQIAKLAKLMVRSKTSQDEVFGLEYIGNGLMATAELSLIEVRKELVKFARIMRKSFRYIPLLVTDMEEQHLLEYNLKIEKYEALADRMEIEISNYLSEVSQTELSTASNQRVRSMLQIASSLERIGDVYLDISRNLTRRKEQKAYFTQEMRLQIVDLANKVADTLDHMVKNLDGELDEANYIKALALKTEVKRTYSKLKAAYINKVEKGKYKLQSGLYYGNLLDELERIAHHASKVSVALNKTSKAAT